MQAIRHKLDNVIESYLRASAARMDQPTTASIAAETDDGGLALSVASKLEVCRDDVSHKDWMP